MNGIGVWVWRQQLSEFPRCVPLTATGFGSFERSCGAASIADIEARYVCLVEPGAWCGTHLTGIFSFAPHLAILGLLPVKLVGVARLQNAVPITHRFSFSNGFFVPCCDRRMDPQMAEFGARRGINRLTIGDHQSCSQPDSHAWFQSFFHVVKFHLGKQFEVPFADL